MLLLFLIWSGETMKLNRKLASIFLASTSAIATIAAFSMQQPAQAGGYGHRGHHRWGIHFGNDRYYRHSIFTPVRNDWRCSNYIDWDSYNSSTGKAWLYEKCREYYSGRERVKRIRYIYVEKDRNDRW
jgi:hypothetical protein